MSWRARVSWRALVVAAVVWSSTAMADGGAPSLGAEIRGRVVDVTGAHVAGVDIVATRPDGSGRRAAISDQDGRFTLLTVNAGPVRVLAIAGRGARQTPHLLDLAPGSVVVLEVEDDATRETITIRNARLPGTFTSTLVVGADQSWAIPASSRQGDLGGVLTALPEAAPPTAPAGGPTVAGLPMAEVPVTFEGFSLSDPVDGEVPVAFPAEFFGAVSVATGPLPSVELRAPFADSRTMAISGGLALTTGARGADGVARPDGATGGWNGLLRSDNVSSSRRLRTTAAIAFESQVWDADPQAVRDPRGRKSYVTPILGWGTYDAGSWQVRGGALALQTGAMVGRGAHILSPGDPVDTAANNRRWFLLAARAERALGPGDNVFGLAVGFLDTARNETRGGFRETETTGTRGSFAANLRMAASLAGEHRISATAGLDFTTTKIEGAFASRQVGLLLQEASAQNLQPHITLSERYVLSQHFEVEAALTATRASLSGDSVPLAAGPKSARSFASRILLAPHLRLAARPIVGSRTVSLSLFAGRTPTKVPLLGLMDVTAAPRSALALPAQDALAFAVDFATSRARVTLSAHQRREAGVIEDRFAAVSGQPEFFSPPGARRDLRALRLEGESRFAYLRVGAAAVLSRLEGNHSGVVDEASGQLRPWSTPAFDGPDVEVNRSGPLPFDRPYGVRAFANGDFTVATGWRLSGLARGRIDAGTPLSATARSAVSGEGQVFLSPRGDVGRTRTHIAFDVSAKLVRAFSRAEVFAAFEAFGLAWRHPIAVRDQRYSDAVATPATGGNLEPRSGYGRAIAYAEPLCLRLRLGIAF